MLWFKQLALYMTWTKSNFQIILTLIRHCFDSNNRIVQQLVWALKSASAHTFLQVQALCPYTQLYTKSILFHALLDKERILQRKGTCPTVVTTLKPASLISLFTSDYSTPYNVTHTNTVQLLKHTLLKKFPVCIKIVLPYIKKSILQYVSYMLLIELVYTGVVLLE